MAEVSWTEQADDKFFKSRRSPAQSECDQLALSITNASSVRPVDIPGSLSYTVICTGIKARTPYKGQENKDSLIVSFLQFDTELDESIVELARVIHGSLVPPAIYHGIMDKSEPPLRIYTMPLLPGVACSEILSYQVAMDPEEQVRHAHFTREIARYFARSWCAPQPVEMRIRSEKQAAISHRLAALKESLCAAVPASTLSELENILSRLFDSEYPLVLTHGDFSKMNILVNPDTFELTGIIDWSLGAVQPFGIDLDCLVLMGGFMDLKGWHDYDCRPQLQDAFWTEFWAASGIKDRDDRQRESIRAMAEAAAKIGAVLRYAFDRDTDGRPSEVLTTSDYMLKTLKACFT